MLCHLRSKHLNALANETPTTEHYSAPTGEGRQKELDNALINMIMKDLQTFSIVEDEGFKAFVNKLNSTYVLPTRKTVKTMVRHKYREEKEKAMAHVKNIPSVCLTADMWTSLTMESYLEVTCHYTDSNTELRSVVLGVLKFTKSHTADNIKKALSDLISD
ncbi:zinc finger BED domain-containing 1-like protein [Labeo rohita]|uniref:Zinc finger BED domain-containing 1-like protein n=1 Tax=Labeo rohita TaxID=84645 RepID=A0A498NN66_LABRO|nr:zinc finger BED domain-containing 1-like protein [Labeo rohita]RXN33261.1 zinc finger BED domain-containing 1-like protein [Labeo rohita]